MEIFKGRNLLEFAERFKTEQKVVADFDQDKAYYTNNTASGSSGVIGVWPFNGETVKSDKQTAGTIRNTPIIKKSTSVTINTGKFVDMMSIMGFDPDVDLAQAAKLLGNSPVSKNPNLKGQQKMNKSLSTPNPAKQDNTNTSKVNLNEDTVIYKQYQQKSGWIIDVPDTMSKKKARKLLKKNKGAEPRINF